MKFERPCVQTTIERYLGCADINKWKSFAPALDAFTVKPGHLLELQTALESDSNGYLVKGLITAMEAIAAIEQSRFSWAVVRLYYSIFYLNRASLGVKGFALVRNGTWVLLRVVDGATPKRLKGDRFRNDHDAVINTYIDLYSSGDFFQSNSVEGKNAYEWLSERRNQVNYQQVEFADPIPPDFVTPWLEYFGKATVGEILWRYSTEKPASIFQPEHAWLAIPFLRAKAVAEEFVAAKRKVRLSALQREHLAKLNCPNLLDGSTFDSVFPAAVFV